MTCCVEIVNTVRLNLLAMFRQEAGVKPFRKRIVVFIRILTLVIQSVRLRLTENLLTSKHEKDWRLLVFFLIFVQTPSLFCIS